MELNASPLHILFEITTHHNDSKPSYLLKMENPVHAHDRFQRFLEHPLFSEVIVRDGLFVRNWKEYTKLHLVDRCFDHVEDDEEKEKLRIALAWLQDLKYIFQGLGPVPFTIRSEKTVRNTNIKKGIPKCVSDESNEATDEEKRKGKVNFDKLTALVENPVEYEANAADILHEVQVQQNFCFQQFLIFNYGEKLNLVDPSDSGNFPYLRKRGLSMKEIELLIFVLRFQPELQDCVPTVFNYLDNLWWSDIFNFTLKYMGEHADVMEFLDEYLKKYVTNTFCTAFQPFISHSDITECLPVEVDWSKKFRDDELSDDDDDDEEDNRAAQRQRLE